MGTKEAEKSPVVMTCDTLDAPLEEVMKDAERERKHNKAAVTR